LLLLGALTILTPFLDARGRAGVLLAAAIAFPVQVVAFGLLVRFRGHVNGFLAVWAGSTAARMLVVGVVAFFLVGAERVAPIPTLLALAGFFFGLILVEPPFFQASAGRATNG
jgi:uncharacterized membrane protein